MSARARRKFAKVRDTNAILQSRLNNWTPSATSVGQPLGYPSWRRLGSECAASMSPVRAHLCRWCGCLRLHRGWRFLQGASHRPVLVLGRRWVGREFAGSRIAGWSRSHCRHRTHSVRGWVRRPVHHRCQASKARGRIRSSDDGVLRRDHPRSKSVWPSNFRGLSRPPRQAGRSGSVGVVSRD